MCDFFSQQMEKDQGGDLTDIIRRGGCTDTTSTAELSASDWPLPSDPTIFTGPSSSSDDFGNPFPNFQDPLLNEFFLPSSGGSDVNNGGKGLMSQKFVSSFEHDMKSNKPCILPRPNVGVVQMSPLSSREIRPCPLMAGRGGFGPPSLDGGGVRQSILSPRTTGMKRRKNQAKKVICIPAPAVTTGGRPTAGEVVPSDLWAWRKYGQKPIKGSPYPRGYYRCSSSKGCSARKQVERSRTDPNMLVITYTSEHNHPWPTQRNALAGSTRSQQAAKINCSSSNKDMSQNQKQQQQQHQVPEEELNKKIETKKEIEEMNDVDRYIDTSLDDEFDQELLMDQYKPMIPESSQPDDFFADLQELEADPMNLIFTKEYMEAKPGGGNEEKSGGNKAPLDPFSLLDWGLGGSMK
ncbi:hypothetical protein LUZ60_016959 [Juncus effusus]|nr:hypothetical protein LUZ60_016959 [Juncus effusus]